MTRDDSSGGWVPLSGGGLANVSVRRRATSSGNGTTNTNGNTTTSTITNLSTGTSPNNSGNSSGASQGHGSSSTSPPSAAKRRHEYLIYGKRITDQSVSLLLNIFNVLKK